jgi:hypothetical protein
MPVSSRALTAVAPISDHALAFTKLPPLVC